MSTLYDDLGVPADATAAEIKAAGKRMAKQHHPDRGGDPEAFDRARKALTILSDPERREKYDATGDATLSSDPEADEMRDAGQLVMQGMIAVLQDEGLHPEHTDITARIRQHIEKTLRDLANSKRQHEAGLARMNKFLKRLKVKEGVPDPVGDLLRSQVAAIHAGLAQIERQLRVAEKAKEIAGAYSYTTDGPDMQRAFQEAFAQVRGGSTGSAMFDILGGL